MIEGNRRLNLLVEVDKAEASLKAAELCFRAALWDDAVSRAYYAAYHMVQALLLTEGLEAKTHEGTHDLFYLHFVKPGRVPAHLAKVLAGLQRFREQADYSRVFRFTRDGAKEELDRAREVHQTITRLLEESGWLPEA